MEPLFQVDIQFLNAPTQPTRWPCMIVFFFPRPPFKVLLFKVPQTSWGPGGNQRAGPPHPLVLMGRSRAAGKSSHPLLGNLGNYPPFCLHTGLSWSSAESSSRHRCWEIRQCSLERGTLPMLRDLKLDLPAVFWFCRHVHVCSILEHAGCWNIYETCSLKYRESTTFLHFFFNLLFLFWGP